jgi:predicted nucleic acid-binding protein
LRILTSILLPRVSRGQALFTLSYRDSLILAAAERAGCGEVHSEDLEDGQVYNRVRVVNPFKA